MRRISDLSEPLIKIQNLSFAYTEKVVLDIADLEFNRNQSVFIAGPSGSGKSTLLNILAAIHAPAPETIDILGFDMGMLKAAARDRFRGAHIGYIFQSLNLIPYLTVRENILLPMKVQNKSVADAEEHLKNLASELQINEQLDSRASEISVGQAQRAACARALMMKPEIILADEPTSSLDAANKERFIQLLFKVAAESDSTVIFVSHDESLAHLFDRKIVMAEVNRAV